MAVADFLEKVGEGAATAGRVAGAVGSSLGKRTAEVLSGEAPEIDEEERQKKTAYEGAALSARTQELESQLETGRKYGTLTPAQQQEYVDAITKLYSHPSQMGTLVQKLHKAVHPQGATYQPNTPLPNATPQGGLPTSGTALSDALLAERKAKPDWKNFRDPKSGQQVAIDVNKEEPPPGYILSSAAGGGYVRQSSHVLNPTDAISLMASTGQSYPKQEGNAWTADELKKFPPGIVLAGFIQGDKMFYAPFDQRTKTATWDNVVHQINEAGEITAENAAPEGLARVPTVTTHQVPGMNPGEKITLTGTTTPVTPGAITPKTGAQTVPAGNIGGIIKPAAQQKAPVQNQTTALGSPPPTFAPGTMLTQGRNAEPVVSAMSTVAAQVFGSNGEPPIWQNAWMFDNPDLRTAMNRALTLNALSIPGTEDDPTFTQTLATAAGITGWSQEQIEQANVQARQDLQRLGGDQALNMFARMAGMQEDLSALRAATKGSAAQGSIRTLVRAAPVYNVSSAQNFRDQLGVTLNTAASAMKGYPAINPAYVDWFQKGAGAARGGNGVSGALGGKKIRTQHSASTGLDRWSDDGGTTWHLGKPPQNPQ